MISIIRKDGTIVQAIYVKHLRVLVSRHGGDGLPNINVELYRLEDGTEIVCHSLDNATSVPWESTSGDNPREYS